MGSGSAYFIAMIRSEERQKLLDEGYIRKSDCPRTREDNQLRQLKKANNSLQRKITELTLELNTIKMMR